MNILPEIEEWSDHMSKIITISRQYGSGGREIGKKLAASLNIPFYDNELIARAVKESGFAAEKQPTVYSILSPWD